MVPLDEALARAMQPLSMACAVVNIQAELKYWEASCLQQPFHQPGVPFRHYVPTLKFAYDTYLLSPHATLDDLMPTLAARYERCLANSVRLDWAQAKAIITQVWRRLGAPLHNTLQPLFPLDVLDERAIVAAAMGQHRANAPSALHSHGAGKGE